MLKKKNEKNAFCTCISNNLDKEAKTLISIIGDTNVMI